MYIHIAIEEKKKNNNPLMKQKIQFSQLHIKHPNDTDPLL